MELLPSSPAVRIPLFLKSPDVYDPLQIFLNKIGSHDFSVVVCGSVFNGVNLSCFAAFILLELPPIMADLSWKLAHLHHRGSCMMHQCCFPDHHLGLIDARCGIVLPGRAYYLLPLH